jgi:glycosyltransferase involved in cell wall biosynthesis
MLSIVIPTYNYSALPLVEELRDQAIKTGADFEIIVIDDCSDNTVLLHENSKINALSFCIFEQNATNFGRSKTRNALAEKARYDWLLFMDGDTFPKDKQFLQNYITAITENKGEVFFGGIAYHKSRPETLNLLRWTYGSKREEIKLKDRIQNPYSTTLTSNILISKTVFDPIQFEERIAEYGYEDLVFIQYLKARNKAIIHLDNATFHLNYETSAEFLSKARKALETLCFIEEQHLLNSDETKIQKTYRFLHQLKLDNLIVFAFKKLQLKAEKNLLSDNPSLFVLDLYKLGYFCCIKKT